MKKAGVGLQSPLDWDFVVRSDTLINSPPELMASLKATLEMLDSRGLLSSILDLF
jgi:hypothetical protein